jgi:6-phosphogluconolactonase (cycloisomerase 2 family)
MSIRTSLRSRQSAFFALCATFVSTAILSGCASFWSPITTTTTTTNSGTGYNLVYVGKNSTTSLAGYLISSTGLTAVSGSPYSLTYAPTALAINPANTYLYVGTGDGVYGYSIASGGVLTTLSSSTSSPALYICALDTSTGLFSSCTANSSVQLSGTPQSVKFSPLESSLTTSAVAVTYGTSGLYTYTFDSGTLLYSGSYVAPTLTTASYNGITWNSAGTAVFLASGGADDEIISYPLNSSSAVITNNPTTLTVGADPQALTFNQSEAYLYVTNTGTVATPGSTVSGYTVTMSGSTPTFAALSPTSTFSTSGNLPSAIAYDNTGTYLLVMNQSGPPDLVQYTIDTSTPGRLYVTNSVSTGLTASGTTPGGITMVTTH